ncbi:MAG: hypothetical protein GY863_03280 [bacterium]|nr:hypothetical protein [bacterium]
MCKCTGLELIAQIGEPKNKKAKKLYYCQACHTTFIREKRNIYKRVTPRFFIEDI